MLYCLNNDLVLLSEEESNQMKAESDMPEYVLEAFSVSDLVYTDGVYSFWLDMYLDDSLFNTNEKLGVSVLADPIFKCNNSNYGLEDDIEFYKYGVCDSIENLIPSFKENAWEWQFQNANVDIIRWEIRGNKKVIIEII